MSISPGANGHVQEDSNAAPDEPVPADPVEALIQLLPSQREQCDDHGCVSAEVTPASLWAELDRELHALPPGAARDELLRRGLAAAATWPDEIRLAPPGWVEAWRAGAGPVGWPLARAVQLFDVDDARALVAHGALAEITVLEISELSSERCARLGELLDVLATSSQLTQIRSLTIRVPPCGRPEVLARLADLELPALRRLALPKSVGPAEAEVLAGLPLLARLRELDLSESAPQASGLAALGRSEHLRGLEVLRLRRVLDTLDAGAALAKTPAWVGLRELDLSYNRFNSETLRGLGGNPALTNLEVLDLRGSIGLGADNLRAFVRAGGLPNLEVLRLGGAVGDAGVAAIVGAKQWSGLRELSLAGAGIGPAGAIALSRATHLRDLERLDLAHNKIGSAGAEALARAPHLAGLRHLDLTGCELGDEAAATLLASLRDPATLRLARNQLGDASARAIAAQRGWTSLRVLDVSLNRIGDDGFVALADAPQLAGLERLELIHNNPGERGLRAMVESPHLVRFVDERWRRALALHSTILSPEDAARSIPPDFELTLHRLGCFGTCPIFTVTVRADGSLEYQGERHVRVTGPVQDRVDLDRVRLLLGAVERFYATDPDRRVACNVRIFDNENVAVRVRRDGRERNHASEALCPTAPAFEAIYELANRVDALLVTGRWTWTF